MSKLTAIEDRADPAPRSPIFCVLLVKMGLQTKNQPDLLINVPRAYFLGFVVSTSAPELTSLPVKDDFRTERIIV